MKNVVFDLANDVHDAVANLEHIGDVLQLVIESLHLDEMYPTQFQESDLIARRKELYSSIRLTQDIIHQTLLNIDQITDKAIDAICEDTEAASA